MAEQPFLVDAMIEDLTPVESRAIQHAIKLLRRIPQCGIIENVRVEFPLRTRQVESLQNYLGGQSNHADVDHENGGTRPSAHTACNRTMGHSDPFAVEAERGEVGTCGTHSLYGCVVLRLLRPRQRPSLSGHSFRPPLKNVHNLHNLQEPPISRHFGWLAIRTPREPIG